eukprot:gene9102-biopygen6180
MFSILNELQRTRCTAKRNWKLILSQTAKKNGVGKIGVPSCQIRLVIFFRFCAPLSFIPTGVPWEVGCLPIRRWDQCRAAPRRVGGVSPCTVEIGNCSNSVWCTESTPTWGSHRFGFRGGRGLRLNSQREGAWVRVGRSLSDASPWSSQGLIRCEEFTEGPLSS